jgi:hypothetical protein
MIAIIILIAAYWIGYFIIPLLPLEAFKNEDR